jgi:hypothetical protein
VTYKQKEVLKKIIKKYRPKKERLAQQRTKWGVVEGESWLLQQWEENSKVQIFSDVWGRVVFNQNVSTIVSINYYII